MKTIKLKSIIAILLLFVIVLICALIYSKSYYPMLPFEGVSKREVVSQLKQSNTKLILLKQDEKLNWYGFEGNPSDGAEALKLLLQEQGLTFTEQNGSGYFFANSEGVSVIVESQLWTGKYIIFEIPR